MFGISKRRFLQMAGLAVAEKVRPAWADPQPPSTGRKVIIVTFGGGVRYAETFSPEGVRNIPHLARLRPEGRFFSRCRNSGVLSHFNSTASIVTGQWQRVDDFGVQPPSSPTLFELYRKQRRANEQRQAGVESVLGLHGVSS